MFRAKGEVFAYFCMKGFCFIDFPLPPKVLVFPRELRNNLTNLDDFLNRITFALYQYSYLGSEMTTAFSWYVRGKV